METVFCKMNSRSIIWKQMGHQLILVVQESERNGIALKCSQVISSEITLMEKRRKFLLAQ